MQRIPELGFCCDYFSLGKDKAIIDIPCDGCRLLNVKVIVIEVKLEFSLRVGRKERLQLLVKAKFKCDLN